MNWTHLTHVWYKRTHNAHCTSMQFEPNYIHMVYWKLHSRPFDALIHALSISSSISLHNLHIAHCTLHMQWLLFRCFTISRFSGALIFPVYILYCILYSLQFAMPMCIVHFHPFPHTRINVSNAAPKRIISFTKVFKLKFLRFETVFGLATIWFAFFVLQKLTD